MVPPPVVEETLRRYEQRRLPKLSLSWFAKESGFGKIVDTYDANAHQLARPAERLLGVEAQCPGEQSSG